MTVELVYTPELAEYRLAENHPLRPERFTLAYELMRAWGLVCESADAAAGRTAPAPSTPCATVVRPQPAPLDAILAVHTSDYVAAVRAAGANPAAWRGAFGIGPGDTPAFAHMHEASALVAGATMRALADVVAGTAARSFSPAGGLHHAHRDHASGFCVYNDCAIAIQRSIAENPGLRVAYVDVDTHHGDGVQDAFYDRADVLTISVHESGRYLFPGTGRMVETGTGAGLGYTVNFPLGPGAGDEAYAIALEGVVAPALRAFAPDVILAQLGADSHASDPLSHLATTVRGQYATTTRIIALADEICGGRIAATGGGGYDTFSAVPRAWACALAALLGADVPAELPDAWRLLAAEASQRAGEPIVLPRHTFDEAPAVESTWGGDPLGEAHRAVEKLHAEHPLLHGAS